MKTSDLHDLALSITKEVHALVVKGLHLENEPAYTKRLHYLWQTAHMASNAWCEYVAQRDKRPNGAPIDEAQKSEALTALRSELLKIAVEAADLIRMIDLENVVKC